MSGPWSIGLVEPDEAVSADEGSGSALRRIRSPCSARMVESGRVLASHACERAHAAQPAGRHGMALLASTRHTR